MCDIISSSENADITILLDNESELSKTLWTDEEKKKLLILKESTNREDIEKSFWETQKSPILNGEIMPLLEWSSPEGIFCFDLFTKYKNLFTNFFNNFQEQDFDFSRRALLTRKLQNYPCESNANYSFGLTPSFWKTLINKNKNNFKFFFDDLDRGVSLQTMIEKFIDETYEWYCFIKRPELLQYCLQKNIRYDNNGEIILISKKNITSYHVSLKDYLSQLES